MKRFRYVIAAAALALTSMAFVLFRSGDARAQAETRDQEEYRVELVQNDQYKVQKALNAMERQRFYYVSCIPRNDGKILLIFRKYQQ